MSTSNPWLNPLQRSYNQIRSKLIDNLKLKVPEITDFSEGNIFMLIISIFSAIAEVIHYYIDAMASETFFVTARRYSSLKKHSKLVDYHIRSANPAQVDLFIELKDGGTIDQDLTIPAGLIFTSNDDKVFVSTKTVLWQSGSYGVTIPVAQKSYQTDVTFGINSSNDIIIYLGDLGTGQFYVEGSMSLVLTLNGVDTTWDLVETFAYSKPNSKHFMVELDDNYLPYMVFGNGVYGMKPPVNSTITGSFYITYGADGNINAGSITSLPTNLTSLTTKELTCINLLDATGGSDYENFDMVKEHLPLSIKTLGVAISIEDYESIARLTPGVDKAYVDYLCGKFINIYITPDGGGIASSGLCDDTYKFIIKRKVITTSINVYPTKEALIIIEATITGKKSYKANDISLQVINALFQEYSYDTSDIARAVRLSDLYALIDGQTMVDYLKITNLYLVPTFKKVGATSNELNVNIKLTSVINPASYLLRYVSATNSFNLVADTGISTGITLPLGTLVNINLSGNTWSIQINAPTTGSYSNGDLWKFAIPQNNADQVATDFTIPIFSDVSQISLNIIEKV